MEKNCVHQGYTLAHSPKAQTNSTQPEMQIDNDQAMEGNHLLPQRQHPSAKRKGPPDTRPSGSQAKKPMTSQKTLGGNHRLTLNSINSIPKPQYQPRNDANYSKAIIKARVCDEATLSEEPIDVIRRLSAKARFLTMYDLSLLITRDNGDIIIPALKPGNVLSILMRHRVRETHSF